MDEGGASRSEPQPRREEVEEQTYRQNDATVRMKRNKKKDKNNVAGMTGGEATRACVCACRMGEAGMSRAMTSLLGGTVQLVG